MKKIQQLGEVLKTRNTDAIIAFVKEHTEVLSEINERGISGLILIAYHQLPEVLSAVIPMKQPLTLYEAIACGQLPEVKNYIAQDTSLVHQVAADGFPLLSLACYFGHREVATYLLEKGANVHAVATNGSNIQALHAAVARNDAFLCQLLLEKGAAVNAQQTQNVTPLHSAVHRGNLEITKLLVQHGADTLAQMDNGTTPLSIAEQEGHSEIVQFFKELV